MIDPREIWASLGIVDNKTNEEYYQKKKNNLTQEDFDILSPDNIDNNLFWQYAATVDDSCIAGSRCTTQPRSWINKANIWFLEESGALSYLDKHVYYPGMNILEIGPGFGSYRQSLPHYLSYRAIDCCPRFNNVGSTDQAGLIPRYIVEYWKEQIQLIVSSNVFQHMSLKQKTQYLQDIKYSLSVGGYFVLSMSWSKIPFYTAGQFIPGISVEELYKLIYKETNFSCVSTWQNYRYNVITGIFMKEIADEN